MGTHLSRRRKGNGPGSSSQVEYGPPGLQIRASEHLLNDRAEARVNLSLINLGHLVPDTNLPGKALVRPILNHSSPSRGAA